MEAVLEFGSMSAEVKDIIRKVMGDGKEHERKELVSVIEREVKDKSRLTPGIIAGAFKMMCANHEVEVLRRGIYRLGTPIGRVDIKQQVENILIRVQKELDKVCTVNALNLEDEDIEFLKKVKGISDSLEADIWNLIEDKNKVAAVENIEPIKSEADQGEKKECTKPVEDVQVEKTESKVPAKVEEKLVSGESIKKTDKPEIMKEDKPELKVNSKDEKQQAKAETKPDNKKAEPKK